MEKELKEKECVDKPQESELESIKQYFEGIRTGKNDYCCLCNFLFNTDVLSEHNSKFLNNASVVFT